ncbi:MAG: GspE/PulE family protein [Sulfuricellaceae bacterium]|nr:GspE/PulE family protein [Sulfuricellaceae bacterium]
MALPTHEHKLTLGEILAELVADGIVPQADADKLNVPIRNAGTIKLHPLVIIASQKWKSLQAPNKVLTLEDLTQWLARKVGLPFLHIDPLKVEVAVVAKVMSHAYASRFMILPIASTAHEVTVATVEPFEREWEKEISQILRCDIRRVIATTEQIQRFLPEFYNLARSMKGAQKLHEGNLQSGIVNFEQLVELSRAGHLDANDQHVVQIVDWLFIYAFEQRASDIHLEPRREIGNVRFRIDGVMHHVYQIPAPVVIAITSRIKGLGRMDIVEKRRPQDGRIKTRTPDGQEIELRLSTMPTAFGEKLVMRIFSPDVIVQDFKELGFGEHETQRWEQIVSRPNGIVLVTGPTGSGKTTTLYSTLRNLAQPEVNVCTVEDPIEMVIPQFNQMQVQNNIGLDFSTGIRTLMRQDPDIIMIGEIRDLETAEMAIQAALTGHLVLSTLHTNDAPSAITRLIDLGVPGYLINSTVLGVLGQRLIRTLCPHCKEKIAVDESSWHDLVSPWKSTPPAFISAPKGCLECRMTGFLGRSGIYEIMPMSLSLKKQVSTSTDLAAFRDQAYKEGMKPLRISGAQKIAAGLTTLDEVLRVTPPPGQ